MKGKASGYECIVEATCKPTDGCVLRAPSAEGLRPLCKDTFFGELRVRVWDRRNAPSDKPGRVVGDPLLDVTSDLCGLEVGGGPWWSKWAASSKMAEPFGSLLRLPVPLDTLASITPVPLRPPGY
mmetsp:Transcript_34081/g.108304  ORF Transcript_34081/g.108304 Transcript_34081/m.108304 type:complete len:125 (+) Transcript_34081:513-887(+)